MPTRPHPRLLNSGATCDVYTCTMTPSGLRWWLALLSAVALGLLASCGTEPLTATMPTVVASTTTSSVTTLPPTTAIPSTTSAPTSSSPVQAHGPWSVAADHPVVGRVFPIVVWTGSEVIVWGGEKPSEGAWHADGAA